MQYICKILSFCNHIHYHNFAVVQLLCVKFHVSMRLDAESKVCDQCGPRTNGRNKNENEHEISIVTAMGTRYRHKCSKRQWTFWAVCKRNVSVLRYSYSSNKSSGNMLVRYVFIEFHINCCYARFSHSLSRFVTFKHVIVRPPHGKHNQHSHNSSVSEFQMQPGQDNEFVYKKPQKIIYGFLTCIWNFVGDCHFSWSKTKQKNTS